MTAPEVRADTDARQVVITLPEAALADLLIHIAHEHAGSLFDILYELDDADALANAALTVHDISRDEAFERRDDALKALFEKLPALVWRVSADGDVAELARQICYENLRAAGSEKCAHCQTWASRTRALQDPSDPDVWLCSVSCRDRRDERRTS